MAAPPLFRTTSDTPLPNDAIYVSNSTGPHRLPNGPCKFTNLSVGGAAPPRCGCQRFSDQLEYAKTTRGKHVEGSPRKGAGWCMCEHHACFHESLPTRSSAGSRTEESNTLRSSSKYFKGDTLSISNNSLSQASGHQPSQRPQASSSSETYLAGRQRSKATQSQAEKQSMESGLPDTGRWGHHAHFESSTPGLPPVPSQCILPSEISSGGLIGNSQSFQSFPHVDVHATIVASVESETPQPLRNVQALSLTIQPVSPDQQFQYGEGQGESFVQSATEVVTPSPRDSPELGMVRRFDEHVTSIRATVDLLASQGNQKLPNSAQSREGNGSTKHALSSSTAIALRPATEPSSSQSAGTNEPAMVSVQQLVPSLQTILKHVSAHPILSTKVHNHEQRLDLLENVSSSYVGAQEVYEKFDLFDERMGEVEIRVEELEKSQAVFNDMTNTSFRRRLQNLGDGEESIMSQTSSEMISAAIDRTEIFGRLEGLETQLTQFQSSTLPSYAHPWTAEVVFLPFGTDLKGIWSSSDNFQSQRSRHNSVATDHRTQTQYSASTGNHHFQTQIQAGEPSWQDMHQWSERTSEWLMARACAHRSKVEERLRSRGLVKLIEVKGPGARDVHAAIFAAFGNMPEVFPAQKPGSDLEIPDSLRSFYGLQGAWMPLRKVHKDSRLQFLDPSEMVTSALWTVEFLSSVAMRATGAKRLFITQRESYIQDTDNENVHLTWQKLRVLPRVFPDLNSSSEVREADALEACWVWDERLDPLPSVHSSFASQHSSLSIRRAPSQYSRSSKSRNSSSPAVSPIQSTTPTSLPQTRPISPLVERFRPQHARTTSMPAMIPIKFSPPGKRRIASFDHEINGPTSPQSSPIRQMANATTKRRRMTRSPSRPRDTPRWSVGPPSPYGFEEVAEHKRGTTPFAYATPHSNAPYIDFRHQSVAGMTADDNDEHGSTTDVDDLDGGEQDMDGLDSDIDQGHQPSWEGVDDEMVEDESDQERKALSPDEADDDAVSDYSSQPSEYPSTQRGAKHGGKKGGFRIHIDKQ